MNFISARKSSVHFFSVNFLLFSFLTYLSWYVHPLFSLFSFVPYLQTVFQTPRKGMYYLRLYTLNISWNILVTFWLCEVDIYKGVGTILINSFLFLLPVLIWNLLIRYGKVRYAQAALLLLLWILFEYFHHIWDFSWTWLTIGNVFGRLPGMVLWYAYAGVLGGSIWILCCNYICYTFLEHRNWVLLAKQFSLVVAFPLMLSLLLLNFRHVEKEYSPTKVTLVGTAMNGKDAISDKRKMEVVDSLLVRSSHKSDIIILPEVLLTDNIWLNRFSHGDTYTDLKRSLQRWNTGNIIVGAFLNVPDVNGLHTEERMGLKEKYNLYNSALMVNATDTICVKLKKTYVPVEEYVPSYLSFLHLKSYNFSRTEHNSDHFKIDGHPYFICICYEAINSVFIATHMTDDTRAFLMLSSESFFGKSEVGREQYKNICRLRCIENNLPLFKSSNDGILFCCSSTGEILAMNRNNEPALINATINLTRTSIYHTFIIYLNPILIAGICMIVLGNVYAYLRV